MERNEGSDLSGVIPQNPVKGALVEGLVWYGSSEVEIGGKNHLLEITRRIRKRVPTIFAPNHISNADGPVLYHVLKAYGISTPVFLIGEKLRRNPVTSLLADAVPTIRVWPESLKPQNKEEEESRNRMNRAAFYSARDVLKSGSPLIVFPEGTRSRRATLQRGVSKVSGYFQLVPDTEIAPVGISMTDLILPPKAALPRRGYKAHLEFGGTIRASELRRSAQQSNAPDVRQSMIDMVMYRIAGLLPDRYRGEYASSAPFESTDALNQPNQ